MSQYRIGFAPEALELVEQIRGWWIANRRANPRLFDDELAAVCRRLATAPHTGKPYPHPRVPGVRRILMPRTRYHVYYMADDAALHVWVLAVWHVARGEKPPL